MELREKVINMYNTKFAKKFYVRYVLYKLINNNYKKYINNKNI